MQGFQNIWICIFMTFLRISRYFQISQLLSSIVPVVFTLGPPGFLFSSQRGSLVGPGTEEEFRPAQASGEAAHSSARRVRRRGASTAVLGVRARRWRRVERPKGFRRPKTGRDEGTARGRRPGLGRRPRLGQRVRD